MEEPRKTLQDGQDQEVANPFKAEFQKFIDADTQTKTEMLKEFMTSNNITIDDLLDMVDE